MTVHEPMTFATDMALAALSAVLAHRLMVRAREVASAAMGAWGVAIAVSAGAAFAGGVVHGFQPSLGHLARPLWVVTLLLVGLTGYFLVVSALHAAVSPAAARRLMVAPGVQLLVFAVVVTQEPLFRYAIYQYGLSMVVVALVHAWRLAHDRAAPGAAWILAGIALSVVAAAVQFARLAPHPQFNHNDLYHVIQMAATAVLYRGGRDLR